MAGVVGLWRVPKKRGTRSAVKGVPSAERALAVLTAFRRGDGALSLAELAGRTGLVKSTIMRLAVSLQQYQLLARLPDGRYRLDAGILRLGTTYQQAFNLEDEVVPILERLAAETGETATFYVRHGEDRLCLFRVESASPIRMRVQPGDIRPMDDSAVAKVLRRTKADRDTTEPVTAWCSTLRRIRPAYRRPGHARVRRRSWPDRRNGDRRARHPAYSGTGPIPQGVAG